MMSADTSRSTHGAKRAAYVALLVVLALGLTSCQGRVPDLKGKTVEQAKRTLQVAQLRLGTVTYDAAAEAAPGSIVAQDPRAGRWNAPGGVVNVTVAGTSQPRRKTVPDVTQKDIRAAKNVLVAAGFNVEAIHVNDAAKKGTVLDQKPAGGETVPSGITVKIAVSSGRGGGDQTGGDQTGGDQPTVLLHDDFSGPFPGGAWEANDTPVKVTKAVGKRPPSLAVGEPLPPSPPPASEGGPTLGGSNNGIGSVRTVQTFGTGDGFTLSFDLLTKGGNAGVSLIDISEGQWGQDRTGMSVGMTTASGAFMIAGGGKNVGPPRDNRWHHYEFRVAGGRATWSRDGAPWYSHAYGPRDVYVRLGGGDKTVWFDNVSITSP